MKKKLILSFLIAILMFNALLPSSIYADTPANATNNTTNTTTNTTTNSTTGKGTSQTARNEVKRLNSNEVESTKLNKSKDDKGLLSRVGSFVVTEVGNFASVIVKIIAKIFCFPPYGLQLMMAFAVKGDNEDIIAGNLTDAFDATKVKWFTIENAVFNKIPLLNVDFFDVQNTNSSISNSFRQSVASWYQTTFLIAQIASIAVLIYIGIRMAIASTMEAKAEYKKMFKDWLVGFALLFLLHYGMVIIVKANNLLISLIPSSLLEKNYEVNIISKSIGIFDTDESVWSILLYVITYWVMIGFELYFLLVYFKRLLTVAFLVIIAPLITVTYAIDKVGDGKAQAYTTWVSLFLGNVFMQAVQAFMYAIFIYSASAIAEKAPIIAILFFLALTKGEDVVNKLFNVNKSV